MLLKYVNLGKIHLPLRGLLVLAGATLMLLSESLDYSYGNLVKNNSHAYYVLFALPFAHLQNTYVMSYLKRDNDDITYEDWIFIAQVKPFLSGVMSGVGGEISRRVGLKKCLAIGVVIYSGGYLLTYFALDLGLWACVISMAVCHGIAFGLTYTPSVSAALKWFPGRTGIMGSIAVSGYGFGASIWNPLETAFVNPRNVKVEEVPGEDQLYFTDDKVLDMVPWLFVLLGGIILVMGIIATILIEAYREEREEIDRISAPQVAHKEHPFSVKPMKVLQTGVFWKQWLSLFCASMTSSFMASYQKVYGQTFVQNDTFFATVAIFANLGNGLCRLAGGTLYDYMGFKFTMMIVMCLISISSLTLCDVALINSNDTGLIMAYLAIWNIGLFSILPAAYACYPPELMAAFGPKYNATVYGLLFSSTIAYSTFLLLTTELLLPQEWMGYDRMFVMIGIVDIIGTIAIYMYPNHVDPEDFRAPEDLPEGSSMESISVEEAKASAAIKRKESSADSGTSGENAQ